MADTDAARPGPLRPRPLSPHLSVYRPTLTMTMSIVHRITGAALYAGTLLMAWWLIALSGDAGGYAHVARFMRSFLGQIILFGYTWALLHHMFGGIRHFVWDTGRGLDDPAREWITRATLAASIAGTLVVWIVAYAVV